MQSSKFYIKILVFRYLPSTRGVSLKKTAKNRINNVPINKKVYTNASIFSL
jgi:hypothetical protein